MNASLHAILNVWILGFYDGNAIAAMRVDVVAPSPKPQFYRWKGDEVSRIVEIRAVEGESWQPQVSTTFRDTGGTWWIRNHLNEPVDISDGLGRDIQRKFQAQAEANS